MLWQCEKKLLQQDVFTPVYLFLGRCRQLKRQGVK